MFKKILLIGLLSACMIVMAAPDTEAWTWNSTGLMPWGSYNLAWQLCGVRGSNTWHVWADVTAEITGVNCYCRNKPYNSKKGKALKFIGTDYDVSQVIPVGDFPQDDNGCILIEFTITDAMVEAAAAAADWVCPNDNWHQFCELAEVDATATAWAGRSDVCTTGSMTTCEEVDFCDATFFDPDPDTGIFDFTSDECPNLEPLF